MGSTAATNAYIQVAWTVVSDMRDKTEITPLALGLGFINQLKPVSYKFRVDRGSSATTGPQRYGFIAQDVLAVEGENPVIIDADDPDKLRYQESHLIAVLVKAVQELSAEVAALKAKAGA